MRTGLITGLVLSFTNHIMIDPILLALKSGLLDVNEESTI